MIGYFLKILGFIMTWPQSRWNRKMMPRQEPIRWSLHLHCLLELINPFPSRFINRTIFFCNALAACCLTQDNTTFISLFSLALSFLYQCAKPPQETVLFIDLLGKELTPRACMGDWGSIWWVPVPRWYLPRFQSESWCTTFGSEFYNFMRIKLVISSILWHQ